MKHIRKIVAFMFTFTIVSADAAPVAQYIPPEAARQFLGRINFAEARPIDEAYRSEFTKCDGLAEGHQGKDKFLMRPVPRPCSTDPSRVRALLSLADGGVFWESKMALDVDGSFAATSGKKWKNANGTVRSTTDQCGTTYKWMPVPGGDDCKYPDAQVDPDRVPYAVIPAGGAGFLPRQQREAAKRAFRQKTGLAVGDLGVIINNGMWTPAMIADTGPIYRLGEASSGAFAALGQSRCRGNHVDTDGRCIGDGTDRYPYVDAGIGSSVIYIFFPGTGAGLTKDNVIQRMCDLAKTKLGLTGARVCPT